MDSNIRKGFAKLIRAIANRKERKLSFMEEEEKEFKQNVIRFGGDTRYPQPAKRWWRR